MSYYTKSFVMALGAGVLLLFILSGFVNGWRDITAATLFALFFTFSGFLSFFYALKSKGVGFYSIVIGSIFIRMIIVVSAIIFWIRYQSIEKGEFLISLVLWYALLLIPEIIAFNRLQAKERV